MSDALRADLSLRVLNTAEDEPHLRQAVKIDLSLSAHRVVRRSEHA